MGALVGVLVVVVVGEDVGSSVTVQGETVTPREMATTIAFGVVESPSILVHASMVRVCPVLSKSSLDWRVWNILVLRYRISPVKKQEGLVNISAKILI